jgi:hypothetical protein
VIIPGDIEILSSSSFSSCQSFESISFESNSRLTRIESRAFPHLGSPIAIPSTVLFIAHDASPDPSQLSLCDENSCPEFGRWRWLRQSGIVVDFRRIVRGGACLRLRLDLTGFEEGSVIGEASRLYRREKDGLEIVVKAFDISEFEGWEVENAIENLSNLRHPLIAAPIGFAMAEGEVKLKIGRLHAAGGSLGEVVSAEPVWWTPTAKAEAVVGIALALRFAHGFGLVHGSLKAENVLFDGEGRIHITDFRLMRRGGGESGRARERDAGCGFSGEEWTPRADVSAFAMLLCKIVAGRPSPEPNVEGSEVILPPDVPGFVSEIIEGGLRPIPGGELSFIGIFETLEANAFRIVAGVDSNEVSAFVSGVESAAQCSKSE